MAHFAANLTYLFTELPMQQRFAAARRAGFQGVEILFPYDIAARDLSRAAIAAGLEFVLMNPPPPNWAGGPRGFAAVPGGEERFRRDFDRALRYAQVLRSRHIHVMAGAAEGATARQTYLNNLAWACDRAPHASLTIEPLNPLDMPGYFLADFDAFTQAFSKAWYRLLSLLVLVATALRSNENFTAAELNGSPFWNLRLPSSLDLKIGWMIFVIAGRPP